tara:strand:+ start:27751 stop:28812 length:1062 start_codon:yes stop_codon:yes gene_type:complete
VITLSLACLTALPAKAGPITQYTGFDNFNGTCPGARSASYLDDWGPAIAALNQFSDVSEVTYDDACRFNRNQQARFYEPDTGSLKAEFADFGWPSGVAFTESEVGTLDIDTQRGTTSSIAGDIAGPAFGSMTLDDSNLGLPEVKLRAQAAADQRLTVNGFAATEFLWTGETTDLNFFINFDFFGSNEQRCLSSAPIGSSSCTLNSAFALWAGVSTDMPLDGIYATSNISTGTVITETSFFYDAGDLDRLAGTEASPIEGVLDLTFSVSNGDRFFLWAGAQAFAIDGGFLDAANTVTTDLRLFGDAEGTLSRETFAVALQAAPPTAVSAPATLLLLLAGLAALMLRHGLQFPAR